MMKVQEVILKAMVGGPKWWEATCGEPVSSQNLIKTDRDVIKVPC
jgi:hypothetical protein